MQEEYLMNKMLKGKTEQEKEIELLRNIVETREKLKNARSNFEYAEDDMIDYYILWQTPINVNYLDEKSLQTWLFNKSGKKERDCSYKK